MKKNNRIKRVEFILDKYKRKNDSYMEELRTTYDEYKALVYKDKATINLYVRHMEDLCNIIEESHSGFLTIILMFIILILTSVMSVNFYLRYQEVKDNLDESIIKANAETNMQVTYVNLESFSILQISDEDYISQKPITINIKSSSKNYVGSLVYRVYMVPKNNNKKIINTDNIKYTLDVSGGNIGINKLSDATKTRDNKILLYEGTMNSNDEVNIDYYMWLDKSAKINQDEAFNFIFYIDGYVK